MHTKNPFVLFARALARACSPPTVLALALGLFATQTNAAERVSFTGSIREVAAAQPGVTIAGPVVVRSEPEAGETAAPITFEIALRMRNFPEFQSRVIQGRGSRPGRSSRKYSPLAADEDRVVAWIQSQGLVVTRTDPNHLAVFGSGSVAAVQQAFHTRFARVAAHGAEYTSAVTPPSLPAEIAAAVLGIHGLQPHIRPRSLMKLGEIHAGREPFERRRLLSSDIATAYKANGLGNGAGQTIAICEWAYPAQTDLGMFWRTVGVSQKTANVTQININGGPASSPDTSAVAGGGARRRMGGRSRPRRPDSRLWLQFQRCHGS